MCGIFGVFSDYKNGFNNKQLDVLGQNIIINQFRGVDSTGLFQVNLKGESDIIKVLGGAGALFSNEKWDDFQRKIGNSAVAVVGHGRSATRGTVKIENAHPFVKTFPTGEILKLVHNGTLDHDQELPDFHKFDVDSEWIAEMIVRYGPLEALTKIHGALALVWWDEKDKTINFFRNNDRPLHFGRFQTNYDKTFILNSEAAAVRYLSERNGLSPIKKDTPCFYFSPRTHYSLKITDLFGDWESCEEFAAPKKKVVSHYVGGNVGKAWNGYYNDEFRMDRQDYENVWARERNYKEDIDGLKRGIYRFVEFEKVGEVWKRRTQFENYSIVYEPVDAGPYLPGLRKMERTMAEVGGGGWKHWVRMTWWDETEKKEHMSYIGAEVEEPVKEGQVIPFKKASSSWEDADFYKQFADVGCQKFSPGRKFRWTTKDGIRVIRHVAHVSKGGGPVLESYKNDADGAFNPGDFVMIEIQTMNIVAKEGKNWLQVEGTRVDSKVDRAVDVLCYYEEASDDAQVLLEVIGDLSQAPFISGVISRIELAPKDRQDDTNACVVVILQDMELVWEEQKTEPEVINATTH